MIFAYWYFMDSVAWILKHNLPCVFCHQLLELADGAALVMTTFDGGWGSCGASKIAAKTVVCIHSTRQDRRYLDKYTYDVCKCIYVYIDPQCSYFLAHHLYKSRVHYCMDTISLSLSIYM